MAKPQGQRVASKAPYRHLPAMAGPVTQLYAILKLMSKTDPISLSATSAHITERVAMEGSSFYSGSSVAFVESPDSFVADVQRASANGILLGATSLESVPEKTLSIKLAGDKPTLPLKLPIISKIVKRKIHAGLGRLNTVVLARFRPVRSSHNLR